MGLGTTEILLICFLALILFGGGKLAEMGRGMGEGIKNFKRGLREANDEEERAEAHKLGAKLPSSKDVKDKASVG